MFRARRCSGNAAGEARAIVAPAGMLRLLAGLAVACLLAVAPTSASAHRFKHVCSAVPRGRAACMAERLLLGAESSPALTRATRQQAGGRRTAKRTASENRKPYPGFLTPERLHLAYDLPDETVAGSPQTIAVVDAFNDPTAEADLAVYDQEFGLPECTSANGCFTKLNQEGKASPLPRTEDGWAGEISIDVQMAHAICRSCRIMLIEANGEEFKELGAGVNSAVAAGASVVSNSYGEGESPSDAAVGKADYNHPGVPLLVSTGDCGYINQACPERPAGADFPSDVPTVVAVGGTSLTESGGIWTSKAWDEGGSGCSTLFDGESWQSELSSFAATGCASERGVADVSAIGDPNTGVDIYDSTPEERGAETGWGVWGGTSVASPIVAGEFGLAGGGLGVAYPASTLYAHFGQATALYDVTSGDNGTCAGSTICNSAGGFDGPTGIGSPVGLEAFAVSPESSSPPTITAISQSSGITGSKVIIEGTGLDTATGVSLGASAASFTVISPGQLEVTIPSGSKSGKFTVTTAHAKIASKAKFTVTFSITSFKPGSAGAGTKVTIKGVGFTSSSTVAFGGVQATQVTTGSKKLLVLVPAGAQSGPITVTNTAAPAGTVSSSGSFTP